MNVAVIPECRYRESSMGNVRKVLLWMWAALDSRLRGNDELGEFRRSEIFVSLSEVEGVQAGLSHFDCAQCDNPIDVNSRKEDVVNEAKSTFVVSQM